MKTLFKAALVFGFILLAGPVTALCADLNPGSTTVVDLGPAATGLAGILGVVLGWVGLLIFKTLQKVPMFNKLMTQEQFQKLVDPLLDEAVAFGVGRLKNADWLKIDTKNEAIADALDYVLEHGGELLDKFGISTDTVKAKLEAKLVQNGWDIHPGQWEDADKKDA